MPETRITQADDAGNEDDSSIAGSVVCHVQFCDDKRLGQLLGTFIKAAPGAKSRG